MKKSDSEELFVLYHLDMGLSEEEIEDLIEESSWEQRSRWLKKKGLEEEDYD